MLPRRVIDIHTHLWGLPDGLTADPDDRRNVGRMLDRFGIESAVVMPLFGGHDPGADHVEAGNRAVAEFARMDARVRPFVTVYPPDEPTADRQMRYWIEEHGFAGMKIWTALADAPEVDRLVEQMAHYQKPVLIHALHKSVGQLPRESDPVHIARLAERHPDAKIIMAHIGGNFLYSCDAIAHLPHVVTDVSGSYSETGMVEHAVATLGTDRVLFGTDGAGINFISNAAKVAAAEITDDQKDAIFYRNAKRVLS